MKKQFIVLGMLVITTALYSIDNQLIQKLSNGSSQSFVQSPQTTPSFTLWNTAFEEAKKFVHEKYKNLVGAEDTVLKNALILIEETNADLINAVTVTHRLAENKENMSQEKRSTILRLQKDICERIATNMKDVQSRLKNASITLGNKKEAQNILLSLAFLIERGANQAKANIITLLG